MAGVVTASPCATITAIELTGAAAWTSKSCTILAALTFKACSASDLVRALSILRFLDCTRFLHLDMSASCVWTSLSCGEVVAS